MGNLKAVIIVDSVPTFSFFLTKNWHSDGFAPHTQRIEAQNHVDLYKEERQRPHRGTIRGAGGAGLYGRERKGEGFQYHSSKSGMDPPPPHPDPSFRYQKIREEHPPPALWTSHHTSLGGPTRTAREMPINPGKWLIPASCRRCRLQCLDDRSQGGARGSKK